MANLALNELTEFFDQHWTLIFRAIYKVQQKTVPPIFDYTFAFWDIPLYNKNKLFKKNSRVSFFQWLFFTMCINLKQITSFFQVNLCIINLIRIAHITEMFRLAP